MFKRKKRRSSQFKKSDQVISLEEARQKRRSKREEVAATRKTKNIKEKKQITERRAVRKVKLRLFFSVAFLVITLVVAFYAFNIINLKIIEAKTLEEQKSLLEEKERLEAELSQVNSPEYIEQQARTELKMIKPGEILYILPTEDQKTTDKAIEKEQE